MNINEVAERTEVIERTLKVLPLAYSLNEYENGKQNHYLNRHVHAVYRVISLNHILIMRKV